MNRRFLAAMLPLLLICASTVAAEQPFPAHRVLGNVYYVGFSSTYGGMGGTGFEPATSTV